MFLWASDFAILSNFVPFVLSLWILGLFVYWARIFLLVDLRGKISDLESGVEKKIIKKL